MAGRESWDVIYYQDAEGRSPVDEFLDLCPTKVAAQLIAVLDDVAEAPPPRYSGGGRWRSLWSKERLRPAGGLVTWIRPVPDERLGRNVHVAGPYERAVVDVHPAEQGIVLDEGFENGTEQQVRQIPLDDCPVAQRQANQATSEGLHGPDLKHGVRISIKG